MSFLWPASARAIALAVTCVVAAAALVTARQPVSPSDIALGDAPEASAPMERALIPARLETRRTVAAQKPATASAPRVPKPLTADVSMKPRAVESRGAAAAPVSKAQGGVQNVPPVTITGCLDQDDDVFWLKNTSGMDAPKSRSWRSGFFRKGSSSVELVDAANTLKLSSYVGQRVAATGTLTNREMQARSLRRVAASCS